MQQIKILALFFLCFIGCNKEINQVDSFGKKTGYWEHSPTDSTLEKGYYEKGLKIGVWEYFKNGGLTEKVFYSLLDSLSLESRDYYSGDLLFLSEKIIEGQTVDVDVKIDSLYRKVYLHGRSTRRLGSDLFLYNCSSSGCHGGYPFVKDEIDTKRYSNVDTLYMFIKKENHGKWADTIYERIDLADIEAIRDYIVGPERKPVE